MKRTACILAALIACILLCAAGPLSPVGPIGGGGGATSKSYTPLFILPDTIFAAVSQECNIYGDQVAPTMPGLAPWFLRASSDSAGGSKLTSRGWRWTPAAAASKMLRFHALDPDGNTLAADSVLVRAVANTAGFGEQRHVFVGDSVLNDTTNTRGIVREVLRLANTVYAHGDSLMTIGPSGFAGFGQVTHSGIRWRDYALGNHANFNPFKIAGKLDFKTWMTANRSQPTFNTLAHSWWLLGYNDLANWSLGHERVTTADLAGIAVHIDSLFAAMLDTDTGYPTSKITICTLPMPAADLSANGASYRAMRFYGSMYEQNIRDYNRYIIARYDAGAWNARVDVCDVAAWVDRKYGYPHTYADPAARAAEDVDHVPIYSNYIHPDSTGHYQIADAIFGHYCGKRAEEVQKNLLPNSDDIDDTSIWTATGDSLKLADVVAPDGETDADVWATKAAALNYFVASHANTGITIAPKTAMACYFYVPTASPLVGRMAIGAYSVDFNVTSTGTTTYIYGSPDSSAVLSSTHIAGTYWTRVKWRFFGTGTADANVSIYLNRGTTQAPRPIGVWGVDIRQAATNLPLFTSSVNDYQSRP